APVPFTVLALMLFVLPATSQAQQTTSPTTTSATTTTDQPVQTVDQFLQQGTSPFSGSVPSGERPSAGVLSLTLSDAIQRGLRYNLGFVLAGEERRQVAAERIRRLSELLPQINGAVREQIQKINLAAFGFRFPGLPSSVGPFSTLDVRGSMSAPIVDVRAITR